MVAIAATLLVSGLLSGGYLADTTIVVPAGQRLEVEAHGGEVVVDTWTRGDVRIHATYGSRDQIRVTRTGEVIRVTSPGRAGGPTIIDYRITVPTGMQLELTGLYTSITVTGSDGPIRANTVNGDITLNGGVGQVSGVSVMGNVLVTGARGTIEASTVSGHVRVRDAEGRIDAEAISGSVVIERARADHVSATTVSGPVYYDGAIAGGGRYLFGSHSGTLTVSVPAALNASVTVAQLAGPFTSSIAALSQTPRTPGRRQTFTVGSGSAMLELETFSGAIRVVRTGEVPPPPTPARR